METHLEKICNICGDIGYEETIVTCSKCRSAHEHLYCMQDFVTEIPEEWACEECTSCKDIVPPGCDGKEDFQISSDIVHQNHDNVIQGGSMKDYDGDLGKHNFCKRQKAVKTGKVKFLPTEEVIKLSSGATKKGSLSKSDGGCRPGSSSTTPRFSPFKTKPRARVIPPGLLMPSANGRMQISPRTNQQALKTSKEQKAHFNPAEKSSCKKQKLTKEVNTCNANMPAEEVIACVEQAVNKTSCTSSTSEHEERALVAPTQDQFCKELTSHIPDKEVQNRYIDIKKAQNKLSCTSLPSSRSPSFSCSGSNYCTITEPENSIVDKRDPLNILPKLRLYRRYFPALHATWKGGFKFFDTAAPGKFYGGFQAQPPCRAHCKAYEFSERLPIVLQVKLLPRCDVWANLFQNDYPDFDDIALYFFPAVNIERSKQNHASLFELMEIQSSVMTSCIDDVELLIFTSKQLSVNSQDVIARSGTENFLWGIFRRRKNDKILCEELTSLISPLECEMEIDTVDGKVPGSVDVAIPKESSRRACGVSINEDTLKELNNKILNAFKDLDFTIQQAILESEQAQHNVSHFYSKVSQKINSDLVILDLLQSSLGKLSNAPNEADIAPGFEEMPRQNFRHMLCEASFREEKSHPNDGRVMSPVGTGLQGSKGDRDGYLQSYPMQVKIEWQKFEYDQQNLNHKLSTKSPSEMNTLVCRSPSPTNLVKLNVVGRSKWNLGVSGASGIISDESGNWILGYILNLRNQLGLAAELWAVFKGLMLAWDRGFRKVLVESESIVAVGCLKRTLDATDPIRDLIDCCIKLIKHDWDCKINLISGEANLCANWLVTHFEDYPLGCTLLNSPPPNLVPFLQND